MQGILRDKASRKTKTKLATGMRRFATSHLTSFLVVRASDSTGSSSNIGSSDDQVEDTRTRSSGSSFQKKVVVSVLKPKKEEARPEK